ncbi:MAG: DUF2703 domain-containing protein [Syntrophorhabdales bacterium]
MKRILIEWFHYDKKERSRGPSAEVVQVISHAVETMRPFLRSMQIQLDFKEIRLTADEMELSGTIRINRKKMEERKDETLSGETLIDAVLKETARFTGSGCAGNPEDLFR